MAPASATQKPKDLKEKGLSRASSTSKADPESPVTDANGIENGHLKELQKSLRNAVKKLNSTAKLDAILAENPGKSLDELIEEKKINNDQKAQAMKKPSLQAAVNQIEEQIAIYKQFAAQYEEKLASQKAELLKAHKEELEAVRGNAIADATESSAKALRERLLTMSKFLCAAANLRREGDATTLESLAFEGVLFQVYGGSQDAVNAMVKLIDGAGEKVIGVEGDALEFTYGDVKQASNRFAPAEEITETVPETTPASDPTMTNAGLTELQDASFGAEAAPASENDQLTPPAQTLVSDAANTTAEKSYGSFDQAGDTGNVELPRDPAETDTGLQATPASADGGLNNGSAGADVAQENGAKGQSNGRRGRGPRRESSRGGGRGRGDGKQARGRGGGGGRGRGGRGRGGGNGSPAEAQPKTNGGTSN
ncbi:hypothetical protein N7499_002399 [Penicillium canescens]|uniref:YAG7-like dimerisation domain-containing protein n=1 Tax=Penicillium canescens TaxID=5083 RepID=A0AAD6N6D4_PENCN|nr:uncharacterized protein N7446_009940 [Penicillium canescens]KAJ6035181.1 hypothetical protein N7460_009356 [Penicillium canescens]KAJ6046839.1 hypothetical protein N7444_008093 [Penicillium canescens]KAJ6053928.1 hypothetical protein N7446_009940 [Penicillium canescens]KAJ6098025.1 hypothetical protein N7499_002399 [Penicillium canescens]KAJ6166012.1 hypothetical protein N7485_009256 [Penicillium canescens]